MTSKPTTSDTLCNSSLADDSKVRECYIVISMPTNGRCSRTRLQKSAGYKTQNQVVQFQLPSSLPFHSWTGHLQTVTAVRRRDLFLAGVRSGVYGRFGGLRKVRRSCRRPMRRQRPIETAACSHKLSIASELKCAVFDTVRN